MSSMVTNMVLPYLSVSHYTFSNHTSTCFILHGQGGSNSGWYSVAKMLSKKLPPNRRVTLNCGNPMPSWFDVLELTEGAKQDKEGILQSVKDILEIVAEEERNGISRDKIVIGGF